MRRYVSPVIPVLDLMIGQVVWAKGGHRGCYAPVHSPLTHSARPVDVAKAIFNQTGCDCLYLANIDSFAGATPISSVYQELVEAGFSLWIDADWMGSLHCDKRTDQILTLAQQPNVRLIFSSETMSSLDEFSIISGLAQSGVEPIFSLDMRKGKVISKSDQLSSVQPLDLVAKAWQAGVRDIILLDLESVGTFDGVSTESVIREVHERFPEAKLISGGGVREQADAQQLLTAGCQHVLVASAIFDCRFTPDDVANLTPFRPCAMTASAMKAK
ncbi:HisA/HisF-related TIM barrel protein [Mariniblastus fucicola]|uniref:1-(5-phosphoribosyl)-5-[(5-phosphoribosylamino)methylideneamino] imidazole-4-carboxamide isomerase n=1 Tax=Mariniblastus fucicola TaxID=980251 RepID=A0A5B9PIN6_9BACT|nr:HisA/HisF-related TIM barrel protein [Mariniblastus fucicola]QEG25110.1 1-(5-phosphoribosyl)-5-[(5-phosphoribosylamino)methylideneamino] imidazole-4-carboxamide isomerase [Mariniblastus fucicola]